MEIRAVYQRCGPAAIRRAQGLLGDEQEAMDVVQSVFERILRDAGGFRNEADWMTYVYRATTNACIDRLRKRAVRGRGDVVDALRIVATPVVDGAGRVVARDFVRAVVARLDDPVDRQIFVHEYLHGMTQAEIAEVVGCTARTVRRRKKAIDEVVALLRRESEVDHE